MGFNDAARTRPGAVRVRCCASGSIPTRRVCRCRSTERPTRSSASAATIVDATADLVCAFKPQFAYFASQRAEPQLERICRYIRETLSRRRRSSSTRSAATSARPPSTTRARRSAATAPHAVTVNPYLGTDSVEPYLAPRGRGVLVLCRTSQPGQRRLPVARRRRRAAVHARRPPRGRPSGRSSATAGSSSAPPTPTSCATVRADRRRPAAARSRRRRPGWRHRGDRRCRRRLARASAWSSARRATCCTPRTAPTSPKRPGRSRRATIAHAIGTRSVG